MTDKPKEPKKFKLLFVFKSGKQYSIWVDEEGAEATGTTVVNACTVKLDEVVLMEILK